MNVAVNKVAPARFYGSDVAALREASGLTRVDFGRLLGYKGNNHTVYRMMRRCEEDDRDFEIAPGMAERLQQQWQQITKVTQARNAR